MKVSTQQTAKSYASGICGSENKVNLQCNKIVHLENLMVMYAIYNSETSEKLINTVHKVHNTNTWNEKLFASKLTE